MFVIPFLATVLYPVFKIIDVCEECPFLFLVCVRYSSEHLPLPVFLQVAMYFDKYVCVSGWDNTSYEYIAVSLLVTCEETGVYSLSYIHFQCNLFLSGGLAIVAYILIIVFSIVVICNFEEGLFSKGGCCGVAGRLYMSSHVGDGCPLVAVCVCVCFLCCSEAAVFFLVSTHQEETCPNTFFQRV